MGGGEGVGAEKMSPIALNLGQRQGKRRRSGESYRQLEDASLAPLSTPVHLTRGWGCGGVKLLVIK